MLKKVNEHQEQEIGKLKRKNKELGDKVTKQPSNFGKRNKKKPTTKKAKNYSEQSKAGTTAKTDLPAQVEEFENQPQTERMQMRGSHRLEEEVSRLKLGLMGTIRSGSKCLVWLLPYCNSRSKNLDFVWDF